MRRHILLWTILTAIVSCDNHSDDFDSFISEDVETYNTRIKQWEEDGRRWVDDPIIITRQLFISDDPERNTIIQFESSLKDEVTITFTQEGLSDDSVDGEKRVIEFKRINGSWTVQTVKLGFKCWRTRGHTNYSGETCS